MRTTIWCLLSMLLVACGGPPQDARPLVLTSVPVHAWLVDTLGGGHIRSQVLLPPGASPHAFQPDDATIASAAQAACYLRTGLEMEEAGWFNTLTADMLVLDLREGLELRKIETHEHGEHAEPEATGSDDPHIWLDPVLLLQQAFAVQNLLIRLDPAHEQDFRAKLLLLAGELERLQRELSVGLLPLRGRALLVYHPSWGYFCDRYGLRQVPVELAGQEPGDSALAALAAAAGEERFAAVFVQPQISGRAAERLAEHLGVPLVLIDPLLADPLTGLRAVAASLLTVEQP